MSVKELQALTKKFADAFDQRDLQPILDMLSEDVEVFDHVPYRFDGKALFAKYLNEVIASFAQPASASGNHRVVNYPPVLQSPCALTRCLLGRVSSSKNDPAVYSSAVWPALSPP
jgi:hypothetical protein